VALMAASELRDALGDVAEHLARRGVSSRLYVVGGAAMALAYDAERATRDIDALILDHHGEVTAAVLEVSRRRGLPGSWLNEQASVYMPVGSDRRATVVFDHPALRVMAASPERLLAMKARAARSTDAGDIGALMALTGFTTVAQIIELVADLFPDEPLAERNIKVLEDILAT
jgi:predicted nucleotidyltransferase